MASRKENLNRAEDARKKPRRQARVPSRKDGDRNVAAKHRMPPVMARTGNHDSRIQTGKKSKRTKKTTLKRRYDISLAKAGSQGVEMRLPAVPVVHPGWRMLSLLLLVCTLLILNYLLTSPVYKVKSIHVEGVIRLSVEEITRTLSVINETIFTLDPEELEQKLAESYPELTNVSVEVNLPAQVQIQVTERVPMIAWEMEDKTLWIDGNGFVFPPRGEAEKMVSIHADASPPMTIVPESEDETNLVVEENSQAFMNQDYINAIFLLKTQAPEGTTLVYDSHHGFGWVDSRGWQVFFGTNLEDIDPKIYVYRAVVQKLEGEGITPELISVAFLHAPYYR